MTRVIHSLWPWTPDSGCAATSEPNQVGGLTATGGSGQISLSWTADSTPAPNAATSYVVERSIDGLGSWSTIATNVTTNSYVDSGLGSSVTRHYRVSSVNCFGQQLPSATANATTTVAAPSAPSSLTATATSSTQIDLAWTDNASDETGFKVERSTDNTNWTEIVGNLAANSTSYSATGLTASTLYYFRVRAYNAGGNSAYTSSASATTQSGSSTYNVEYLVLAGGGSSGNYGGGGAGGYLTNGTKDFALTPSVTYTITVGAGGAGVSGNSSNNGSNSVFSTITATGGGGGGSLATGNPGKNGGSGGGGGVLNASSTAGGTGTSGEGNNGGNGVTGADYGGGGGGGADAAGANGTTTVGGAGGAGKSSSITGSAVVRGGGGGGAIWISGGPTRAGGVGGSGGGGNGGGVTTTATDGGANTGGGGGGIGDGIGTVVGKNGGSGVVIIRMATANYSGTTTGSPTVTTDGSDTILTYNASGTYTA